MLLGISVNLGHRFHLLAFRMKALSKNEMMITYSFYGEIFIRIRLIVVNKLYYASKMLIFLEDVYSIDKYYQREISLKSNAARKC